MRVTIGNVSDTRTTLRAIASVAALALLLARASSAQANRTPTPTSARLDSAAVERVVASLADSIRTVYVFPEAGRVAVAALQGAVLREARSIDEPERLAELLTNRVRAVLHDRHFAVRVFADTAAHVAEQEDTVRRRLETERRVREAAAARYGFAAARVLEGNVGYLDIHGFFSTTLGAALDTAAAAMRAIASTDALILDLRSNGGGNETMVAWVLGHFFDERVHLNDVLQRPGTPPRAVWSTAFAPAVRYGARKPILVLTSASTFSAGEAAAYDLQALKRATVVGERTGGGANSGRFIPIAPRFEAFIPNGAVISPVTGTNWEGVGVIPDVPAPSADAFRVAYARALADLRRTR